MPILLAEDRISDHGIQFIEGLQKMDTLITTPIWVFFVFASIVVCYFQRQKSHAAEKLADEIVRRRLYGASNDDLPLDLYKVPAYMMPKVEELVQRKVHQVQVARQSYPKPPTGPTSGQQP